MDVTEYQARAPPQEVFEALVPPPGHSRVCHQASPLAGGLAHLEAGPHDVLVRGAISTPAGPVGYRYRYRCRRRNSVVTHGEEWACTAELGCWGQAMICKRQDWGWSWSLGGGGRARAAAMVDLCFALRPLCSLL